MVMRLSGNLGFITNSSSAVYHFPKTLLEHPKIKNFIDAYDIKDGYIGSDLWHRGECDTFAITPEQKSEVVVRLAESDYSRGPGISLSPDSVVVIYGDEYCTITSELSDLLRSVAEEQGITVYGDDYN